MKLDRLAIAVLIVSVLLVFPISFTRMDFENQDVENPRRDLETQKKILNHLQYKSVIADSHGVPINQSRTPEQFKDAFQQAKEVQKREFFEIQYYESLIQNGRITEVLNHFNNEYKSSSKIPLQQLRLFGIAYFHRWNCVKKKRTDDCLFPPNGGNHDVRRGLKIFEQILKHYTNDLSLRWLWNLGALSLNVYDDSQELSLPVLSNDSGSKIGEFAETAGELGLDRLSKKGGVIVEDFTKNGRLDVMTSSRSYHESMQFYVNESEGVFKNRTSEAGIDEFVGGINLTQTDYNNDGYPDVYVTRGGMINEGVFKNSLLRNNGDGTFTDVTVEAGLEGEFRSQVAAWADVNKDGYLDLYVGNEATKGLESATSRLYLNQGDSTFTDVTNSAGVGVSGIVRGADWGDINNDGFPDLYVSFQNKKNRLFLNVSDREDTVPEFKNITKSAGVGAPVESRLTWFWDFNNNGRQDLFVGVHPSSNKEKIAHHFAASYLAGETTPMRSLIYINEGNNEFKRMKSNRRPARSYYVQGGNYGDVNLDGYPDIYLGIGVDRSQVSFAPNSLYLNRAGDEFVNVTQAAKVGHLGQTGGVAVADLENDGVPNIYAQTGGVFNVNEYRNVVFENNETQNNWIGLKLIGHDTNRMAVGAQIRVKVRSERGEVRTIYQTVDNGGSYGASPYRQIVGLGNVESIKQLKIEWPVGKPKVQVFESVPLNGYFRINQDRGQLQKMF